MSELVMVLEEEEEESKEGGMGQDRAREKSCVMRCRECRTERRVRRWVRDASVVDADSCAVGLAVVGGCPSAGRPEGMNVFIAAESSEPGEVRAETRPSASPRRTSIS